MAVAGGENESTEVNDASRSTLLDHVLQSKAFRRSKRLRRLLQYAMDPNAQLTERAVAAEVFGRADTFDPRTDTLVRVQFGRLRRRLGEYYKDEGRNDSLRIVLPARGYHPRIQPIGEPEGTPRIEGAGSESRGHGHQPGSASLGPPERSRPVNAVGHHLAVIPFANLTGEQEHDVFCHGLTEELIKSLAEVSGVKVVSRTSAFQFKDEPLDVRSVGNELGVDLVLEGSVRREDSRTRVIADLTSVADGFVIWSEAFDHDREGMLDGQAAIAKAIRHALRPQLASAA